MVLFWNYFIQICLVPVLPSSHGNSVLQDSHEFASLVTWPLTLTSYDVCRHVTSTIPFVAAVSRPGWGQSSACTVLYVAMETLISPSYKHLFILVWSTLLEAVAGRRQGAVISRTLRSRYLWRHCRPLCYPPHQVWDNKCFCWQFDLLTFYQYSLQTYDAQLAIS